MARQALLTLSRRRTDNAKYTQFSPHAETGARYVDPSMAHSRPFGIPQM